jgi:predicted PurR-regulated permease PerM
MASEPDLVERPDTPATSQRARALRLDMPVDVRSVALSIIAAGTVLAVLQLAQSVIIPFVVSALIFYALDPLIDWLQRRRIPRALSAAVVLLLAVGGVAAGAYAVSDDVMTVVDRLPASVRKLRGEFRRPSLDSTALDSVQRTAQALDQAAADMSTPSATPKGVMRV